jgi:hypothetical protein
MFDTVVIQCNYIFISTRQCGNGDTQYRNDGINLQENIEESIKHRRINNVTKIRLHVEGEDENIQLDMSQWFYFS